MCGLSFFFKIGEQLSAEEISDLNKVSYSALKRRGPDNFDSVLTCQRQLLLCHARLSILDLSSVANQPMVSKSGRTTLIFNGEIYNHLQLRKQLFPESFEWASSSDTETLLELIELIGAKEALSKCVGMFAVGIYDRKQRTIAIARDKFGEKPLYYYKSEKYFCGGSTLKVLDGFSSLKLDYDAISQFFISGFISSPRSIYADVHKVEPGEVITYSIDRMEVVSKERFFNLEERFKQAKRSVVRDSKLVYQKLSDQIRDAMSSDVPVGIFQSGGVDSSVVSEVLRAGGYALDYSFTVGFSSADLDESRVAQAIAEKAEREQITTTFTDEDVLKHFEDSVEAFDEPLADPSIVPMMALSQSAAEAVKVVCGGDGGDELFLGYSRHRVFRSRGHFSFVRKAPAFVSLLGKLLVTIAEGRLGAYFMRSRGELRHKIIKFAKACSESPDEKLYWSLLSSDMPDLHHIFIDNTFTEYTPHLPSSLSECSPIEKIQFLDFRHFLADYVLQKVDRSSMFHSLEARAPLLSDTLLQYCLDLHEEQLLDQKGSKKPLLEVLKDLKTFEDVDGAFAKKKGFTPPLEDWAKTILAHDDGSIFDHKFLMDQRIFRPDSVAKVLQQFYEHGFYRDFVWRFLVFQKWYVRYAQKQ